MPPESVLSPESHLTLDPFQLRLICIPTQSLPIVERIVIKEIVPSPKLRQRYLYARRATEFVSAGAYPPSIAGFFLFGSEIFFLATLETPSQAPTSPSPHPAKADVTREVSSRPRHLSSRETGPFFCKVPLLVAGSCDRQPDVPLACVFFPKARRRLFPAWLFETQITKKHSILPFAEEAEAITPSVHASRKPPPLLRNPRPLPGPDLSRFLAFSPSGNPAPPFSKRITLASSKFFLSPPAPLP